FKFHGSVLHGTLARVKVLSSCLGIERKSPDGCHQSLSLCSRWKPRYLAPCHERLLPEHPVMDSSHPVSTATEKIVDRTLSRKKLLGLSRRFEATHLTLSLPRRLMRDLGSIIRTLVLAMDNTAQQLSACDSIAAQLIGHEKTWHVVQTFQ